MEVQETMKSQFGISQLENNFNTTIDTINTMVKENGFVLIKNGKEETHLQLEHKLDWNMSLNQRKKLAKKMYFFDKKVSLRTANSFFSVAKRLGTITDSVKIKVSKKEQQIDCKRKTYRSLQKQVEDARLSYKKEKGDFYKKRLIKFGY